MQTVEVKLNFLADTSQAESALTRLQSSLKNITTQQNLDTGGLRYANELNQASQAAITLRQNLQSALNVNTGKLDLSKFSREMEKSGMSLQQYRVALQQIGPSGQAAFADLSKAILASQTPLTRSIGLMDKLWDTLKRTAGWQISSNIMHGLQSALSNAYGYAQDLNESLNDIRIVTGHSADKMADFAKQANKAAKELSSTTLAYTDASLIYYQQGLDDSTVKERTDTTIKMANVTGTTAETVSEQLTAVWENFQINGEHTAEYYADVMTALGAATASSTDEIAEGLQKFASVADTIGLSYEYAASALTTITAKTRQSADVVGTALKTIFARLEGLSLGETLDDGTSLNKYSNALAAVGVDIKDVSGSLKDMDTILDETAAKWSTLSRDQQMALAQTVAGTRQYTQFVSLMDNWDFMEENLATSYSAEGTLDEQLAIHEESWKAAADRLSSAVEAIYSDLLSDDFFIWLTDGLADVVGLLDKVIDSMGGLAGVLPGLILLMNKLFGDRIMTGISNVAYNVAGLIPSVNTKRQEADVALKNQASAELKQMYEYQGFGGAGQMATKASYDIYNGLNKLEETRLRLGKSITSDQEQVLNIYREQLEVMEGRVKQTAELADAANVERRATLEYMELIKAQTVEKIQNKYHAKYQSGAGSLWLNTVGANYVEGKTNLFKNLPISGTGTAAKGILQYLNQQTGKQINWADVQGYANNDTTGANYDAIAEAIGRLRDRSAEAARSINDLNQILKFDSSGQSMGTLQENAQQLATLENAGAQIENIYARLQSAAAGESSEDVLRLGESFLTVLKNAGYTSELSSFEEALRGIKDGSKGSAASAAELATVMEQYRASASGEYSVTYKMAEADAQLQQTLNRLVTEYGIAPDVVQRLRNAIQNYTRTASDSEKVTEALKAVLQLAGKAAEGMSQKISKLQKIQSVVGSVSSLAMGLSSLTSAINTMKDPDVSGWDEFVSVMMSLSMGLPAIVSGLEELGKVSKTIQGASEAFSAFNTVAEVAWTLKKNEEAANTLQDIYKYTDADDANSQSTLRDQFISQTGLPEDVVDGIIDQVNELQRQALQAGSDLQEGFNIGALSAENLKIAIKNIGKALKSALPLAFISAAIAVFKWGLQTIQHIQNEAQESADAAAKSAQTVSEAYETAKEAQEQFESNLDNYKEAKSGLSELTEGTNEYTQAVLEANDAALELIKNYEGLTYSINDEGLIEIDEDSLKEAQKQQLKQAEYLQWSSYGTQVSADQAQTQANIVETSKEMKTNSDTNLNGTKAKTVGTGVLTGAAAAGLAAAVVATIVTGGLAAALIPAAIAAGGGALAGGMAGGIYSEINGSSSQEEVDAINALGDATTEQWAKIQAAVEDKDQASFLTAARSVDGLSDASQDVLLALYHNFDAVEANVAELQANTIALRTWAEGAAGSINADNTAYQALSDYDQAIADKLLSRDVTEEDVAIDPKYGYLTGWGAGMDTVKDEDEENYLKAVYGDDADQYRMVDKGGTGVTIQKYDKENRAWTNVTDENGVEKTTIAQELSKYAALQYSSEYDNQVEEIAGYRQMLQEAGADIDAAQQTVLDYAETGNWDFSNVSEKVAESFADAIPSSSMAENVKSQVQNAFVNYNKDAYNQKMYEQGQTILADAAETYEVSKAGLEEYTKELVENSNDLYENYKQAAEATARHIKFAKAAENLTDVLDDELDVLKTISKDGMKTTAQLESMAKVGDALAEMYGVDVSAGFFESAENISLLEKAAQGSETSLKQLGLAVSEDYFSNLTMDDMSAELARTLGADMNQSSLDNMKNVVVLTIDTLQSKINELANGTSLADALGSKDAAEEFITSFNAIAQAAGWTEEEVTQKLNDMNLAIQPSDVHVTEVDVPGDEIPITETTQKVVENEPTILSDGSKVLTSTITSSTKTIGYKGGDSKKLKVASIGNKANIVTDSTNVSNAANSIKQTSSGSGGSGGSSKTKKKTSDEIDRYHVVKQQIDRLATEYDALSAAKDRAYGPDKLKAIDKEIAKLQEQEAAQKKYIDEINSYYAKDKAAIAAYGAVFDSNGIITNYDSLMQSQIDKFNASLTDEAEEAYDEFKEILDQYEETLSLKLEEMNSLVEKQYEILSAKLEQISYKVEFKVDLNETELNQLERKLSRLEDREIKSAEYFSINNDEAVKYWQQYAYYQNGIFETEQLINETKVKGLEVTEEMIEQLNEYKEKLGEIHDEIYEIQVNNLESMLDNWDQQYEKLEGLNEQVETYRDILETIKDMRELSGMLDIDSKHSLDSSMISSYQTSLSRSKGINEALVKQRAELVKAQQALVGGESTKGLAESMKALDVISDDMGIAIMSAETLGDKIKSKIDEIDAEVLDNQADYLSLAQEYLEYIKDAYVDNIELIGKKIKDELYDGIDWTVEKYGDLTELSELYLSDTKKNYELNKLNRNILQDINKLDSVAQKQKLRDLMEDISGYYADNVKMSEYELKNLQAQYELRLAEIALEEAQEAKSQVRLTRDNEGRWGYMYTANTEDLAQAEQEYEDKLYALQELQEDTLNETGEKILSTQQEYIDALLEIQSSDEYTDEQKAQRIQSLTDIYQQQLDAYYSTYDKALVASGLAYEDTILGQASNTRSLQDVVERFGQSTTTMIEDIENETGSFQDAFVEMVSTITGESIASYEEAQTAWMKYLGDQQTAWSKATTDAADNFSSVMSTFDDIAVKFKELIQDMLAQLTLLSGEDMSKLIRQSLAAGDYDMAVTYANARRAKIDANPSEYAKNDWDETRMRQEINQYAKDPSAITEDQMKDMLATVKEAYNSKADYAGEMQKALAAGEYDKAGLYAEYRALKVHNDPTLSKYAWTQADLQKQIDEWAKDPKAMTDEQKRRILATASQYDTGGYTGAWGSEGKLAILHEKELVLNSDDTAKLLDAMKVVAQLDRMSAWAMLGNLQAISATANQDVLEQNVHIEASFPNVVDHNEIEQAFENIVNLASQYANRK